jgi:glycosyltransferase involved in cell wall biosynthesis
MDVLGQYSMLREQKLLNVHFYIISDDPEKFRIQEDRHKVTLVELQGRSPHSVVHGLVPSLESQFMIFAVPYIADLDYVRSHINRLQNSGREILIRIGFDRGNLIIVRKNTFLDMGGFRDTPYYYLEELIQRANSEERPFDHGGALKSAEEDFPSEDTKSLRHCAIGYEQRNVEADIILPFYGQLEFVEESIKSVVEQDNADVIVHLIDDCSREDTSFFLRRWAFHKNVRVYRNSMNIGQFMTVNNIIPFLETDYMAFMDGDDLSVSNRIHEGVNLLELTRSDLFGSRMRVFGDEYEWIPVNLFRRRLIRRGNRYWNATFPHEIGGHYFPNPSLIMTTKSFIDLGGFADFGDISKNKTTNDTDLLNRYFFSGRGICYSVSSLVHVRRHQNSCTQNQESGWSTPARVWVGREIARRRKLFSGNHGSISSLFGSLGSAQWKKYTQKWEG